MLIDTASRTARVDALVDQLDVGSGTAKIEIFTGSAPAATTDADSGTKLASFDLPNPAFGAGSAGVASGNSLPLSTTGLAAGTAGYWRAKDRNGTVRWQENYATGGLVLNTTTISVGVAVQITAMSITEPAGAN